MPVNHMFFVTYFLFTIISCVQFNSDLSENLIKYTKRHLEMPKPLTFSAAYT